MNRSSIGLLEENDLSDRGTAPHNWHVYPRDRFGVWYENMCRASGRFAVFSPLARVTGGVRVSSL
ncbi:hypothetical protein BH09GEM1_BH09GEM1_04470 [soil metagenome]